MNMDWADKQSKCKEVIKSPSEMEFNKMGKEKWVEKVQRQTEKD